MVVRHGYQPIRAPEKQCTQEEMWTRLAKHAPAQVEMHLSKTVAQSPQEKPAVAALNWLEPVKTGKGCGYALTQCGRFSIVKRDRMYMAWLRKDPPHESVTLGIRPTRKEAERLCEIEADHESNASLRSSP